MKKKLLIILTLSIVISILPVAAYADNHDQAWKDHHD
jgi:hypothetical protein